MGRWGSGTAAAASAEQPEQQQQDQQGGGGSMAAGGQPRRRLQAAYDYTEEEGEEEEEEEAPVAGSSISAGSGAQRAQQAAGDAPQQPLRAGESISLFIYLANEDGRPLRFNPQAAAEALAQPAGAAAAWARWARGEPQPAVGGRAAPIGDWSLFLSSAGASGASSDGQQQQQGQQELALNYLALETPHFHNLTDLVRSALYHSVYRQHAAGVPQARFRYVLPDIAQEGANLVVLQVRVWYCMLAAW